MALEANPTPLPPPPPAAPASPGGSWPQAPVPTDDRLWMLASAVASVPLLLALFLLIAAPDFLSPLGDRAVALAGMPPAVLLAILLVGMVVLVGLLTRSVRPPAIGLVIAVLWMTIGLFAVIIGPATVLIVEGLGSVAD